MNFSLKYFIGVVGNRGVNFFFERKQWSTLHHREASINLRDGKHGRTWLSMPSCRRRMGSRSVELERSDPPVRVKFRTDQRSHSRAKDRGLQGDQIKEVHPDFKGSLRALYEEERTACTVLM